MKPNFALSLSFDGLRLMHRVDGGWHMVGQVALDDTDLDASLARLRDAAGQLEGGTVTTKLLIPNDQIKYIAIDSTRAEDADVRAALEGATPYTVDQLAYDFAKGGGRTYIAAVAKETLDEARQFATEHGFAPVSYAAIPEPFTFVGEAFFGAVDGQTVERDDEPVVVIGMSDIDIPEPDAETGKDDAPAADADSATNETPAVSAAIDETTDSVADVATDDAQDATEIADDFADIDLPATEMEDAEATGPLTEPHSEAPSEPEPDAEPAPDAPSEAPAPVFATRLRADRNDGRPAAPEATKETTAFSSIRAEPTLRRDPAPLAVPTSAGSAPTVSLSANRDVEAPASAPVAPATLQNADPDIAPPITGEAATAVSPDAAAATLTITPDAAEKPGDETAQDNNRSTATSAAIGAVGAARGMFASRRMARAEAKEDAAETDTSADSPAKRTVFGARAQPKPKPVVGGKPRFLGLILTAILLVFLLAIAAFAALSEEGFARWFGGGDSDTQIAATDPSSDPAAPEVATVPPTGSVDQATAPDALAEPTAPTGGQVLTPEEAQRIYAATGVWQRAPRIPLTPRLTTLDALNLTVASRPVVRVPPSPMPDANSVAADPVIAMPIDPPAPDAVFNFGEDGLIVATPEGTLTPDGILIFAGTPALNPPTRPGTVAPVVTPQDQLAAVIPETAEPLADAPDGVIIIAGTPAILPPVRPGTTAAAVPDAPDASAATPEVEPEIAPASEPDVAGDDAPESIAQPEGLNVVAGPPPLLPPVRPGTTPPQNDAALDDLSTDVTAALAVAPSESATAPQTDTARPLARPESIVQAAVAAANAPVLGTLTQAQAAGFRPRTRPADLAPPPPPEIEEPVVEPAAAPATAPAPATPTLQISPEIAAAVQAAANRPNPIVNPTAQAVPVSSRPDTRPRNMARIVERANEAETRAAAQVAAQPTAVAPTAVAPSGPTGNAVAQNATLENAIRLRDMNLIGIYGGSNDRRALVRMGNGRYVRVTVGDRLDGGRVTAISAGALSYTKNGRALTLQVPG